MSEKFNVYMLALERLRIRARKRRAKAAKSHSLEEYNEAHGEATGLTTAMKLAKFHLSDLDNVLSLVAATFDDCCKNKERSCEHQAARWVMNSKN